MTPLRYEIRQMLRKHPDEQGYIIARALDTTPGYVSKVRKEAAMDRAQLEEGATELEAEIEKALKVNNPCWHTGFESTVCEICGYPDPRKMITKLKDERDELEANNAKLRAFWDWSREADKMTFEQYHWTKQALRGGEE